MKILHTSDWHIGRQLDQHNLLEDQRFVLNGLIDIIKAERPDVLIIAGDLYDRTVPSREALALVDDVLSEIVLKLSVPTIVIGGNHDGRERLDYNAGILRRNGLYMIGTYQANQEPIVLHSADNLLPVAFWPVPFIKPVEYRNRLKLHDIPDYNAMYADIVARIKKQMTHDMPNVLITHGLILSGMPQDGDIDDSVRPIEIGGVSYADASLFSDFDYVALGHLHRPQKVGSDRVRYAGSLLKYSFSEITQKKSVTLVEIDPAKPMAAPAIKQIALPYLHDVREITGKFDELTGLSAYTQQNREDYLRVVLTDETRVVNPMENLRQIYPNVLELAYAHTRTVDGSTRQARIKEHLSDPMRLFEAFYQYVRETPLPEAEADAARELFRTAKDAQDDEERKDVS